MRNKVVDTDFPRLDNSVGVGRALVSELEKETVENKLDDGRHSESQDKENKSDQDKELNVGGSQHELSAVGSNKVLNLQVQRRLL